MAVLVLASASGAPGTTTTGLGLALTWPRDVVLVDADRNPAQAILAGLLQGTIAGHRGLAGVMQAHREHRDLVDAFLHNQLPLPELHPPVSTMQNRIRPIQRHVVPGLTHPGAVELFDPVWRELMPLMRTASVDSIWDVGRIGVHGLPQAIADVADRVFVVVRSSLVALAGLRLYLPVLTEQIEAARLGLIVVGPGRPYSSTEIATQFGISVAAELPWEPKSAAELSDGIDFSAMWIESKLGKAYLSTAFKLADTIDRHRTEVWV